MTRSARPLLVALALASLLPLLAACTTVKDSFPGQDSDQVWQALVAAARSPDYASDPSPTERWFVKQNEVAVFEDEPEPRIEIYRELHRVLHHDQVKPLKEDRTWKLQVVFQPAGEPGDTPRATFRSRGAGLPAKARREGERYFRDVRVLLGVVLEPPPPPEGIVGPDSVTSYD